MPSARITSLQAGQKITACNILSGTGVVPADDTVVTAWRLSAAGPWYLVGAKLARGAAEQVTWRGPQWVDQGWTEPGYHPVDIAVWIVPTATRLANSKNKYWQVSSPPAHTIWDGTLITVDRVYRTAKDSNVDACDAFFGAGSG